MASRSSHRWMSGLVCVALGATTGCHAGSSRSFNRLPAAPGLDGQIPAPRHPAVERTSAQLPTLPPAAPVPGELKPDTQPEVQAPDPLPVALSAKPAKSEPAAPTDAQIDRVVLEAMTKPEPPPKPVEPLVAPRPAPVEKPPLVEAPPPSNEKLWRDALERLKTLARARAAEVPSGVDPDWPLRERLLAWMSDDKGAAEAEWISQEGAAGWRTLLDALQILARTDKGADLSADPSRKTLLRDAVRTLEERIPFEITELALCRKVVGFGDFETMSPPTRSSGQPLVIYAELEGLAYEPMDKGFRSRLASRVELYADGLAAPVWSLDLGTAEDRCRRRRRDYYVNNRFNLPDMLKPGEYRLKLIQTDLVSGKSAGREVPLTINP